MADRSVRSCHAVCQMALDKAVELALIGGYCVGSITPQQMRTWLNEAAEAMHRRESRRDWTCRQDVLSDE